MYRNIVVKVGTSTLSDAEGRIDLDYLGSLAGQLCDLLQAGSRVVLVSSGAVRAGVEQLGWEQRPRSIALKQTAAAVGQGRLMALYAGAFQERGRLVGQVLLTRQLAQERVRYVYAQNTLQSLLHHGVVPIVNENDTVAIEELQFGDNDTLAALVSALVGADLLVLLTNVEGLLGADGQVVPRVPEITEELRGLAGSAGRFGSGGMATKLSAAEIAGAAGVRTVIARGRRPGVLAEVANGEPVGTCFDLPARKLRGRKHWLAYGTQPRGSVTVNTCAADALVHEHKSLLPVGIVAVRGPFHLGDTVSVLTEDGRELARGLASCDWQDVQRVMGARTEQVRELLGHPGPEEVVHRDNLVVLNR
ncbi:MAG: glutamate 5-kinase [Armatimonadota bacterium]